MSGKADEDLKARVEAIEAGYEFMLAYAAQGVSGGEGTGASTQVRGFLEAMEKALDGLGGAISAAATEKKAKPAPPYAVFANLVEKDAEHAQAAVRLVLAQHYISSQLVDNLNAMIHVRAILTDMFLVDEILNPSTGEEGM